jgi:energy-coupling factor transporter ATP-binding protein EcfA2
MKRTAPSQEEKNLSEVEDSIGCIFCAEPKAADFFDTDPADILNPEIRAIVEAALMLRKERALEATVELLAAAGAGELDDLRQRARRVTQQMRLDWTQALLLVKLAAQKRRALALLYQATQDLVQTPLFGMNTFGETFLQKAAGVMVDRTGELPVELDDLLEQVEQNPGKQVYDPMPTGIPAIDLTMDGGIRKQETVVLVGPEKGGKTTILRHCLYWMGVHGGQPIIHGAADGGNATRHALIYLGMHAAYYCLNDHIPTLVEGHGADALHWRNLALWIQNQNPKNTYKELMTPILPPVEERLIQARADLRRLRQEGSFLIVDPQTFGSSVYKFSAFVRRRYYERGTTVVAVDHLGKFGEAGHGGNGIYDRTGETVQELSKLPNQLQLALIMLSQMTSEGIRDVQGDDEDSQVWSAGTQGGRQSQQEADGIFQTLRKDNVVKLRPKLMRDGGSHRPWQEEKVHLGTGLFLAVVNPYKAVEGY